MARLITVLCPLVLLACSPDLRLSSQPPDRQIPPSIRESRLATGSRQKTLEQDALEHDAKSPASRDGNSTAAGLPKASLEAASLEDKKPDAASSAKAPLPRAEDSGPFPASLAIGKPSELSVPGDRSLRLIHAPERDRRAIIYLHGMCGDPYGADRLAKVLVERGTVISLRADVPCGDRPGYKWPKEAAAIQLRIDRALQIVRQARGGRLEVDQVLLMGYSQGAHRAELLLAASPERYPRVVLGGPPTAALPENFSPAHSVAILGGELEDTSHMQAGQEALSARGISSRFFLLPSAGHGDYGPEGPRVVSRALAFLFEKSP